MVQIKTYITIAGTEVQSKCTRWNYSEDDGDEIPDIDIEFVWSVLTLKDIENGQEVVVKRGATTGQEYNIFKGKIDTIIYNKPYITIKCKNMLIDLVKRTVNTSFDKDIDTEAGVGSAIVNTLITTYGGLSTNSGATVVNTGTSIIFDKYVCRKADVFERIRVIKDIFDYQLYYNYDDSYVYFEPKGYTTNSNVLTVGDNVSNIPKWLYDNTQLVNEIRVEGAEVMVETTESGQIGVDTGYSTTSVLLTQIPFSTKVFSDAADPPTTLLTGGVIDSTSTFDYYLDKERKLVIWNSTYTAGANDHVIVQYTYPQPVPIIRSNQASIDKYGKSSTIKHFSDIQTIEDATNRGELYLSTYSTPFVSTVLNVPSISNDYKIGQYVEIVDNVNNVITNLPITRIVRQYPHKYDQIYVGNKEYSIAEYNRLTLDRLKRLEEEMNKNDELLVIIIDLGRTFKPRRRYFKQLKSVPDKDNTFILGDPNAAILGTSKLGVSYITENVVTNVLQGQMTYKERAYDTDFHDSVNSTATFSTVTNDISFTSGQIWYSEAIDLGTTLSYITVTLGTTTGTLKIEFSSDGKASWQTLTSGTRTAVTSSDGTGSYIKITETGSSTATIDNTTDSYGQISASVIEAKMEE